MSEQRDIRGRFAVGNNGGPGRPRRAMERDYLVALANAVPMDRWQAIVQRAIDDAEQGDPKAREWLAGYLVGRPHGDGLARPADAERPPDALDIAIEEPDAQNR